MDKKATETRAKDSVRQILADVYEEVNWAYLAKRYFGKSRSWLYHKFSGMNNGVPDDFKYLMAIESNVDPLARSGVGAAGLWQFMPETGREFGLTVNSHVDERYHVEKATRAACKYLQQVFAPRRGRFLDCETGQKSRQY